MRKNRYNIRRGITIKIIEWFKIHWLSLLLLVLILLSIVSYFYFGDKYNPDFWKPSNITGKI